MFGLPSRPLLPSGLLARWPFDSGSGLDVSGSGLFGIPTNGPTLTPGIVDIDGFPGNALKFNGTNQYVVSSKLVNIALATLSVWMKMNGNPASQGRIAGFIDGIASSATDKSLFVTASGVAVWYIYDGASKTVTGSKIITDNRWHLITGVADGSNMILYVDGEPDGSAAAGNTYTGYTVPNVFLSAPDFSLGTYIAADLDDFQLFNRGLSPVEIKDIYNSAKSSKEELWFNALAGAAINGTLGVTIDPFVLTSSADLLIQGALAQTLAAFTLAAAGDIDIKGALAATIGDYALSATGTLLIKGALASTIDPFILTAMGSNPALAPTGVVNFIPMFRPRRGR